MSARGKCTSSKKPSCAKYSKIDKEAANVNQLILHLINHPPDRLTSNLYKQQVAA